MENIDNRIRNLEKQIKSLKFQLSARPTGTEVTQLKDALGLAINVYSKELIKLWNLLNKTKEIEYLKKALDRLPTGSDIIEILIKTIRRIYKEMSLLTKSGNTTLYKKYRQVKGENEILKKQIQILQNSKQSKQNTRAEAFMKPFKKKKRICSGFIKGTCNNPHCKKSHILSKGQVLAKFSDKSKTRKLAEVLEIKNDKVIVQFDKFDDKITLSKHLIEFWGGH